MAYHTAAKLALALGNQGISTDRLQSLSTCENSSVLVEFERTHSGNPGIYTGRSFSAELQWHANKCSDILFEGQLLPFQVSV